MSLSESNEVPAPLVDDASHGGDGDHGAHAVPRRILLGIYFALLVFTGITYGVSRVDLGPANIWVALLIAVIKGSLVILYFMHLRWDTPMNAICVIAAFFFVALFIGMTILDTHYYEPNIKNVPNAPMGQ
jgi:cytochrome c oxidase subunit IV